MLVHVYTFNRQFNKDNFIMTRDNIKYLIYQELFLIVIYRAYNEEKIIVCLFWSSSTHGRPPP